MEGGYGFAFMEREKVCVHRLRRFSQTKADAFPLRKSVKSVDDFADERTKASDPRWEREFLGLENRLPGHGEIASRAGSKGICRARAFRRGDCRSSRQVCEQCDHVILHLIRDNQPESQAGSGATRKNSDDGDRPTGALQDRRPRHRAGRFLRAILKNADAGVRILPERVRAKGDRPGPFRDRWLACSR